VVRSNRHELPPTAYLVLGILATNDEELTAGEIKTRAELTVGNFYWSPSVSHIRRELSRLIERNMVGERTSQSGKRSITSYATTEDGEQALRAWVESFPGTDEVVIKHPVILKTWLARDTDAETLIETLDRHVDSTRTKLDEALWARQRMRDIGLDLEPRLRYSIAVLNYSIRALYDELSNIGQLRDEIACGTAEDPLRRVHRPKGSLHRRDR
jgi:DNA-binding PadR family transcriptional regulator